MVIKREEM
ncbi:hypothetical protein SOVF_144950, partial [Spinacia oleracea]